jgi:hypothetical protein
MDDAIMLSAMDVRFKFY